MTTITLSNQNPNSECPQVSINIASGMCTLPNNQYVDRWQLINVWGFSHPLLTEQTISSSDPIFHYEYNDINGLFYAAIYVYSTLLKSANPLTCQFKISPSAAFQRINTAESIYFSIHQYQCAEESIHISQLEALVSHLNGFAFKFTDQLVIDEEFTMADLPATIDGDLLYKPDEKLLEFINKPRCLSHFELRYINPTVGFGVFSRKSIQQGDITFLYNGKKNIHDDENSKYAFEHRLDCLNMYINARKFGNLARFVNHAPNPSPNPAPLLLEANLDATSHYLYGIEVIVFSANRNILQGEQLLVNYGKNFFRTAPIRRFKKNPEALHGYKKIIERHSHKTLTELRIMASHGVQRAARYLFLRALAIFGIITVVMGILTLI